MSTSTDEQVVAGLGAVLQDVLLEQPGGDPLSHQPSLRIREGHDHRVDLTGGDAGIQLLDAQVSRHLLAPVVVAKRSTDRLRHQSRSLCGLKVDETTIDCHNHPQGAPGACVRVNGERMSEQNSGCPEGRRRDLYTRR